MHDFGIPASITLGQGILESGAGTSQLAQNSNNHFGIKCGSSWTGETYTHFDDGRWECFRVYDNPEESYRDHSLFLQKERYKSLYKLDKTDYRAWAYGLKNCGYATSPTYATRLIDIIERYSLHQYDTSECRKKTTTRIIPQRRKVKDIVVDGKLWHRVQVGETMYSISQQYNMKLRKLYKKNHLDKDYIPKVGDLLLVKPRK